MRRSAGEPHRDEPARRGDIRRGIQVGRLHGHLGEAHADPFAQCRRRDITATTPGHQRLQVLFQPELTQAGPAAVQVLSDPMARLLVGLVIEVEINIAQDVVTVDAARPESHNRSGLTPVAAPMRPRSRA